MDQQSNQPTAEEPKQEEPAKPQPPEYKILSQEERNDLRKRVLARQPLTLFEARSVYETLRQGQGGVVITGETAQKKKRTKKEGMTDAALDASLDKALNF